MLYILYGSDSFSRSEKLRALKRELDADGSLESNTAEFEAGQGAGGGDGGVRYGAVSRRAEARGAGGRAGQGAGFWTGAAAAPYEQTQGERAPGEGDEETTRGPWQALVEYAARIPETTSAGARGWRERRRMLFWMHSSHSRRSSGSRSQARRKLQDGCRPAPALAVWRSMGAACSMIAELIGNDTGIIASEIEKLLAYANGAARHGSRRKGAGSRCERPCGLLAGGCGLGG